MSSSTTMVLPSIAVPRPTDLTGLWQGTNMALQQMNRQFQQLTSSLNVTKNTVTTDGTSGGGSGLSVYPLIANSVGSTQLVDASIINSKIAANAVQTANILDSAITTLKIANAAVTNAQVAVNTITGGLTGNLASATITAYNIVAATITASQIAASTILGSNIAAATITGSNIAALTITASNIAANTITASQIAAGTITTTQIAAGTIIGNNIAANTITASNLSVSTLSAISANLGTVTAGTLNSVTITSTSGTIAGFTLNSNGFSFGSGVHALLIANNNIPGVDTNITFGDTTLAAAANVISINGMSVINQFGHEVAAIVGTSAYGFFRLCNTGGTEKMAASANTGVLWSSLLSLGTSSNETTSTITLLAGAAGVNSIVSSYTRGSSASSVRWLMRNDFWSGGNYGMAAIEGRDTGVSGGTLAFMVTVNGGGSTGVPADAFIINNDKTLQFGSVSALASEVLSGYILIKDLAGTTRKLAIIS